MDYVVQWFNKINVFAPWLGVSTHGLRTNTATDEDTRGVGLKWYMKEEKGKHCVDKPLEVESECGGVWWSSLQYAVVEVERRNQNQRQRRQMTAFQPYCRMWLQMNSRSSSEPRQWLSKISLKRLLRNIFVLQHFVPRSNAYRWAWGPKTCHWQSVPDGFAWRDDR